MVLKTNEKVVIEVTDKEIEKKGFDNVWDNIRKVYGEDRYELHNVENNKNKKNIKFFELIRIF